MLSRATACGLLVMSVFAAAPGVRADTISPIFGAAAVTPTTAAQNKTIVGKGYYADFYGSYGISFANYAAYYGQYGYYATAATYADYAYQYFNTAAYYQSYGY
ncbi:MAG: hypothetical protein M3Y41_22065 [Pseudomonadota bacterium]|nr:hypothetical protein [Pseudomonadota bacterium]